MQRMCCEGCRAHEKDAEDVGDEKDAEDVLPPRGTRRRAHPPRDAPRPGAAGGAWGAPRG
jgi:hypothetical protein